MSTGKDQAVGLRFCAVWFAVAACILLPTGTALAQSPDEHASHHPGAAPTAGAMSGSAPVGGMSATAGAPGMAGMGPPTGAGPPAGAGGMMEGMGEMMKNMGKPPPKQLYPALMSLPELTPEKRLEVELQAGERIDAGIMLMGQALDALTAAAESDNYQAMHEATRLLREGIAQFDSGIAARRALAEGKAPRAVALTWFKSEMSLASPVLSEERRGLLGLSFFHVLTMVLLVVFALAMLAMYFFKMRRAAALFGRIEPDKKSPPPGSSPPLEGGGGSPGGKSPPTAKPGADSPAPPAAADKTPAPAPGGKPLTTSSPSQSVQPAEPPAEKPPSPAPPPKAS